MRRRLLGRLVKAQLGRGPAPRRHRVGLSLSRHLMELMGGTLDLQSSAEGAGSTFVLRLAA